MLQFAGHNSLTVEVGNFLNLKGTFQSSGELVSSSEKKKRLLVLEKLKAKLFDLVVLFENMRYLLREFSETLNNVTVPLKLRSTILTKRQCEHDQSNVLGSIRFRGSDANFWTSIDVNTTVSQEGDR